MLVEIAFWRSFFCYKWPIAVLVVIPQSAPSLSPHNAPGVRYGAIICNANCIGTFGAYYKHNV